MAPPSRSSSRQRPLSTGHPKGDGWTRTIMISDSCPQDIKPKATSSWKPSDFDITKTLFVGKRSVIYRATILGNGQELVLKVYVKNRLAAVHRKQVEREIQIHGSLSHPNIIKLYAAFEDEHHVYLMIESASKGDLLDDMNKRETFYPAETIVRFISQILDALNYLHKKGIMHRDMKPENIVIVDNKYSIKIIDFGLSIDYSHERPVSAVGTLQYMAPEVITCPTKSRPEENKDNPMLQYGTGADIWAVGILTYELLTGRAPFDSGKKSTEEETEQRIMYMEPSYPKSMDPAAIEFVKLMISKTSLKRPAASELLCHRWITTHDTTGQAAASMRRQAQLQKQQSSDIEASVSVVDIGSAPSALTNHPLKAQKVHEERTGSSNPLLSQQSMANIHQGTRPSLANERSVPVGMTIDQLQAGLDGEKGMQNAPPSERHAAASPQQEHPNSDADMRSVSNKASPGAESSLTHSDGHMQFTGSINRVRNVPDTPSRAQQHNSHSRQQAQTPTRSVQNRRPTPQLSSTDSSLILTPRKSAVAQSRNGVLSRGSPTAVAASLSSRGFGSPAALAAQRSFNGSLISNRTAGYNPAGTMSDKILQQRLGSAGPNHAGGNQQLHMGGARLTAEASAPAMMSVEARPVRIGQVHGNVPAARGHVMVMARGGSPSSIVRPSTTHTSNRLGAFGTSAARPVSRGTSGFGRSTVQKSPAFARWTPGMHSSSKQTWGAADQVPGSPIAGSGGAERWSATRTMPAPASSREAAPRGTTRPSLTISRSSKAFGEAVSGALQQQPLMLPGNSGFSSHR